MTKKKTKTKTKKQKTQEQEQEQEQYQDQDQEQEQEPEPEPEQEQEQQHQHHHHHQQHYHHHHHHQAHSTSAFVHSITHGLSTEGRNHQRIFALLLVTEEMSVVVRFRFPRHESQEAGDSFNVVSSKSKICELKV